MCAMNAVPVWRVWSSVSLSWNALDNESEKLPHAPPAARGRQRETREAAWRPEVTGSPPCQGPNSPRWFSEEADAISRLMWSTGTFLYWVTHKSQNDKDYVWCICNSLTASQLSEMQSRDVSKATVGSVMKNLQQTRKTHKNKRKGKVMAVDRWCWNRNTFLLKFKSLNDVRNTHFNQFCFAFPDFNALNDISKLKILQREGDGAYLATLNTLYGQRHWATPLSLWIQVFSVALSQVYKLKHPAIQSAYTNICERMNCSKELTEFKPPNKCNKLVSEMCPLLHIPRKAISGIPKFRSHGDSATQWQVRVKPQSRAASLLDPCPSTGLDRKHPAEEL